MRLPAWALLSCFAFLALSFCLDVMVTVSCADFVAYERNPVFRFLARRFGVRGAVPMQAAVEAGLVSLVYWTMGGGPDASSAGIASLVFGTAHIMAWRSNRRFVRDGT